MSSPNQIAPLTKVQSRIRWVVYACYNLLLLAWIVEFCKSPYDIGYLFILEACVIGLCAFVLLLTLAASWRLWLLCAPGFAAAYFFVMYMLLFCLNTASSVEKVVGGIGRAGSTPGIDEMFKVLEQSWRPGTEWILPAMLAGPGYLFVSRYIKSDFSKLDYKAVLGHAFQRMGMVFLAYGLSIIYAVALNDPVGIVWGVLTFKIIWDVFENSRWFTPYNFLGITRWVSRNW